MECPYTASISMAEFSKRFREYAFANRVPLTGSIELTSRCNLHCTHCYINLPAGDTYARAQELSAEEWYSILDQIADAGCLSLLLTGGEVFVRPDFLDIYTYAKQKGLLLTIFTNGTTITPQIAGYLAEWLPRNVEITLYGATQATCERVTGVPGSYQRCMRGIELLLERDIPLGLKSTLTSENRHELPAMKAYAESLGVPFRFDAVLNLRFDGGVGPGNFRISPQEVVSLDLQDEKRGEALRGEFQRRRGPTSRPDDLYQCGAGINSFHIDAYGQLSVCMMVRQFSYDLRTGSFHDGWHHEMNHVRQQQRTKTASCQSCDLFALCAQCPGFAFIETNDQEQRVDYLCEITHLREAAFGSDTKSDVQDLSMDGQTLPYGEPA